MKLSDGKSLPDGRIHDDGQDTLLPAEVLDSPSVARSWNSNPRAYIVWSGLLTLVLLLAVGFSNLGYSMRAEWELARANSKTDQAVQRFKSRLNAYAADYAIRTSQAARVASEALGRPDAMVKVVTFLAVDQVSSLTLTESYLDETVRPIFHGYVQTHEDEISNALGELETELKGISLNLSAKLEARSWVQAYFKSSPMTPSEAEQAFNRLLPAHGIDLSVPSSALPGVPSGIAGNLGGVLLAARRQAQVIAARVFAGAAARVVASGLLAKIPDPSMISKTAAVVGFVWSVVEIAKTQEEYKREIQNASKVLLERAGSEADARANTIADYRSSRVRELFRSLADRALLEVGNAS